MKKISVNLLCEKGWCHWNDSDKLVPDRHIVSYCDVCKCQRPHRLIRFDMVDALYLCPVCDGIRW